MLPTAVSEHYDAKKRLSVATLMLVRREWAAMGRDFDASWAKLGPRVTLLTASAQLGAAKSGGAYVGAALEEIGSAVAAEAAVNPAAFAGVASDGRPLASLLDGAVIAAKTQAARGAPPERALAVGGRVLERFVSTQIDDAARGAASVEIAARPTVGWVRMVSAPCCDRCAILAGKWFRYSDGFERHPQCGCTHIPSTEDTADDVRTDVGELFRSGQVRGLTESQRKAIDLGADPSQVVNTRRKGSMTADGLYTREGTTRRGYSSYVRREIARQKGEVVRETTRRVNVRAVTRMQPRPTPEAIFRYTDSREQALKVLRANGYVLGDIREVAASAL